MNKTPMKWKSKMKKAFGITTPNTKQRGNIDKRKRDQKSKLQPVEVVGRVKEEDLVKQEQNVYKIIKREMKMV